MKLVKPKKFLGQHFLKDLKVAQDIADTVDTFPELPVLEVGPGMGVLTQFLVKKDRLVKVVEVDYESVAYLREAYPSLEDHIIEDDFLKMNLHRLFDGKPFVLTGNYPYNISSQIFFKMLENKDIIPCCTGMIQKEVAERIAAGPGSKTYGILSVLIQAWYKVEYLFTVSGQSLPKIGLIELRNVLRRWLKVVFTTCLNSFSSHPSSLVSLRVMRMTALFTFGGGLKTCSNKW